MSENPPDKDVDVRLTSNEALVLFELLSRWTDRRTSQRPSPSMFETAAEPIALNGLLSCLEKLLAAPFAGDYVERLRAARAQLVERGGEDFEF